MRGDARYCQWRRGEVGANVVGRGAAHFPWAQAFVDNGDTVAIASLDALPAEASADRAAFEALNLQSAVLVPFVTHGAVHGALTIGGVGARDWRSNEIRQIRLLAEVLSNASAREQAEFEVQRAHQELAQVARMVSMGELTTSLAHDLNQPLTGILSNAQAASRFLDEDQPSLIELREIVSDIIDDNRRARDVITRTRDMLTRRDSRREPVDINAVVRDVALLITSETIIRNVSVTMAFAPGPVSVIGARIELQQAMLNVLANAMEAVADRPVAQRLIDVAIEGDVRDGADETAEVRIVVRDSGAGLQPGSEAHLFEPCFTEDQPGGIGLAVARSIVENHGGMIAASCVAQGAVVTISLPQAQGSNVE
jgi:C4-dicarboxylate-specific signal transduction histidine kinase